MIENKIIRRKKELEKLETKEKKREELIKIESKIKQLKRKNSMFSWIYYKLNMIEEE